MGDRIAFVLPNFEGGGAERVALIVIQDFVQRGYQVDLLLMEARGEFLNLLPDCVEVIDLGARQIRNALRPLVRYLRQRRPYAIQISMWPLTIIGIAAHRLARSKARIVVSDHAELSRQYQSRPASDLVRITTRLFYPLANARIVVSNGAADDLARLSGIARAEFEVIYNPVPPPPQLERRLDIESLWRDCGHRIIHVGVLKEEKNQELLIKSFARLRRHTRAKLLILGDGPLRQKLEALADREGVAESVLFVGFRLTPWPYLASAELFVLTSDHEGFGNVIVEALRMGLTVVSTDCPSGPREILDGGRFGLLVPCNDEVAVAKAMHEGLMKPYDPSRLKERAEQISGKNSLDRYLNVIVQRSRA